MGTSICPNASSYQPSDSLTVDDRQAFVCTTVTSVPTPTWKVIRSAPHLFLNAVFRVRRTHQPVLLLLLTLLLHLLKLWLILLWLTG